MTAVATRTCSARDALLELTSECGLSSDGSNEDIRLALLNHVLNSSSHIRTLEGTIQVLRCHRIPQLEGDLSAAHLNAVAWCDRAIAAESRLARTQLVVLVAIALFGMAAVFGFHFLNAIR
jgi:hypothetical protein